MADRLALFRLMAKQIAKQTGLFATFMPKPYTEAWGSGAHFNMSLVDIDTGDNVFRDADDRRGRGWSKTAYSFVAGILRHAPALASICTPTVNSYKRLRPRLSDGSVSWAPTYATYGDNNRSCLLRLPRNRPAVENRGVDSATPTWPRPSFSPPESKVLVPVSTRANRSRIWCTTGTRLELAPVRSACPATCSRPSTPSTPTPSPGRYSPLSLWTPT
jgi:hypothetical protein